jgi:hypothetical protein
VSKFSKLSWVRASFESKNEAILVRSKGAMKGTVAHGRFWQTAGETAGTHGGVGSSDTNSLSLMWLMWTRLAPLRGHPQPTRPNGRILFLIILLSFWPPAYNIRAGYKTADGVSPVPPEITWLDEFLEGMVDRAWLFVPIGSVLIVGLAIGAHTVRGVRKHDDLKLP